MERIVHIIDQLIVGEDAPAKPLTKVSLAQKIRLRLFKNMPYSVHSEADQQKHEQVYEIEKAVLRIGNLLRLGLGEAGSKIISGNMKDGEMTYEAGGRLVHGMYTFCV